MNHLIIGLGGTGGRVIRAFRKQVCLEFGVPDPVAAGKARVRYFYVDSDADLMKPENPSWRVLGRSVQLGAGSQLLITGADLRGMLANIGGYPGIKSWIGSTEDWRDILLSTVGDVLGGQKRRLGRFLFAMKANQFEERVRSLVADLEEQSRQKGCTIHVVCGLAGGTGSGSVVDAVAITRALYPDAKRYRIRLYAYLPETHPNPEWAKGGNYHANSYAALIELNALKVGKWQPHDVRGREKHRPTESTDNQYRFREDQMFDAFTGCYLYTNVNEHGRQLDVTTEIPELIGDFLYQKLLFAPVVSQGDGENAFMRAENNENRTDTSETLDREPVRSKHFLAFGMKRILVPEDEIQEYLAFNFAHQGCLQLLYNNWREGFGFVDEPRSSEFRELVEKPEYLEKWRCSDEHLTLSRGVLEADATNANWKSHVQEWSSLNQKYQNITKEKPDKASWLANLEELYTKRFSDQYRQLGVNRLFELKEKSKAEIAKEIRTRVERVCLDELGIGKLSVFEAGKLVSALIDYLNSKATQFANQRRAELDNVARLKGDIDGNRATWAKIGVLGDLVGKREQVISAQALTLEKHMIAETLAAAYLFAVAIVKDTVKELEQLKSEIGKFQSMLITAEKSFRARSRSVDQISQASESAIRLFDPDLVKKINEEFRLDEKVQSAQTSAIRRALSAIAGARFTFSHILSSVHADDIVDLLERECATSSRQAHDDMVLQNKSRRILGINIIEKLRTQYPPKSDETKRFVREVVTSAGVYLRMNPEQASLAGVPSVPTASEPSNTFLILRPNPKEYGEYVRDIDAMFRENASGSSGIVFADIDTDSMDAVELPPGQRRPRTNVVTLIRITNCFPLRFAEQVKFLRERYQARIGGPDPARAVLEVHSESSCPQLPPLFVPSQSEVKQNAAPYLLLALASDCLRRNEISAEIEMVQVDSDGLELEPLRLGRDIASSLDKLDWDMASSLKAKVDSVLATSPGNTPSRRQEIKERVVKEANKSVSILGNGPSSQLIREAAKRAIGILGS